MTSLFHPVPTPVCAEVNSFGARAAPGYISFPWATEIRDFISIKFRLFDAPVIWTDDLRHHLK